MNKITYSLNYRKPKVEYSPNEELLICVRYYHNAKNAAPKIIKKSPNGSKSPKSLFLFRAFS